MNDFINSNYKNRKVFNFNETLNKFYSSEFIPKNKNQFRMDLFRIIEDGIKVIIDFKDDKKGKYIIHSLSTKFSIVMGFGRDRLHNKDKKNHAEILIILSPSDKSYKEDIEKQVIEWGKKKIEKQKKKRPVPGWRGHYAHEDGFYVREDEYYEERKYFKWYKGDKYSFTKSKIILVR